MATPIQLDQIDFRLTNSRNIAGNLVITARGSVSVSNADYALKILASADGGAATVNGSISLTSNLSDVFGLQLLTANYTLRAGSYKPVFTLTQNSGVNATGALVSGINLTLGNAADPAAFGAVFRSTVNASGTATADNFALHLTGALKIVSAEFTGTVSASARSAGAYALAYGVYVDSFEFQSIGKNAQFISTAAAGNKAGWLSAWARGIMVSGDITGGNFGARVTAAATAGRSANAGTAEATACGIQCSDLTLGMIENSFSVTASGGVSADSDAEAVGLSFVNGVIGGFASNILMNISAAGSGADAKGIKANTLQTGSVAGTWNIAGNGNGGSKVKVMMIEVSEGLTVNGDFKAAATVRASSSKGKDVEAAAVKAKSITIDGRLSGSVTVDAKSTGAQSAGSTVKAYGFKVTNVSSLAGGVSSGFKLNVGASGSDMVTATGFDVWDFSGQGALGGSCKVSATASGGVTDSIARAYGITAMDVVFGAEAGNKLVLTVSAVENSVNRSYGAVGAVAYGIQSGTIKLDELGMLTVSAKSGRAAESTATAYGLKDSRLKMGLLSGLNVAATGNANAEATGISTGNGVVSAVSGTSYTVSAASAFGYAVAHGVTFATLELQGAQSRMGLTVRATGGTALAGTDGTSAEAWGFSGTDLTMEGVLSALAVTAVSGKKGTGNTAEAYGVKSSGVVKIGGAGAVRISATGVDSAKAVGMSGADIEIKNPGGAWTVTAASSAGTAAATGATATTRFNLSGAAGDFTIRATGGTLALVNGVPVAGSDSSATAVGIEGLASSELAVLSVTAISGKNAATNTASAYGFKNASASMTSSLSNFRRLTVSASAVDKAEAVGFFNAYSMNDVKSADTVSAVSSNGRATAIGTWLQSLSGFVSLGRSLTVSARGFRKAEAIGYIGEGSIEIYSDNAPHKMRVSATGTGAEDGDAFAYGVKGAIVSSFSGVYEADWAVTAVSEQKTAGAYLLWGDVSNGMNISTFNGSFSASATGKTGGATASGFDAGSGGLLFDQRRSNFSLSVNAKTSGGFASAVGFSAQKVSWVSIYRDVVTVTADGYTGAVAYGFGGQNAGEGFAFRNSGQFALSVTARAKAGGAFATGIINSFGALDIVLGGSISVSSSSSSYVSGWGFAFGIEGLEGRVELLRTLNVSVKNTGSKTSGGAYGVRFTNFGEFVMGAQTQITVKAEAPDLAEAFGVKGATLDLRGNGGSLTVGATSAEDMAVAVGFQSNDSSVFAGALKLTVGATAGTTKDPLEFCNNALAFGLLTGIYDNDAHIIDTGDVMRIAALDGMVKVSAKSIAGTLDAVSRSAHAAALASESVKGSSLVTFKGDVQANSADRAAVAYGVQGSYADGSEIDFAMEGNWKVAAVSATGRAEAYGAYAGDAVKIAVESAKTQIQVSAQTDADAEAHGFSTNGTTVDARFAGTMIVTAASRKNGYARVKGVFADSVTLDLQGTIAVTASGGSGYAAGIYGSGAITVGGAIAAASAKSGGAYAIQAVNSQSALNLTVSGALFGGRSANAASVATQLLGLVKSGGSAASLLGSIKPATNSNDRYYAVYGGSGDDSVTLANNAISVGDIALGLGTDTLTVSATSQVIGNVTGVEKITIHLNADPGKAPIFTVRDEAGSLDSRLFATLDDAQLGTYILAQGSKLDIGAMMQVSLVIGNIELFADAAGSSLLDTGAYGRLSIVTSGNVSKLVLEVTFGVLGTEQTPSPAPAPGGSSSLDMPLEAPPAAGSSGLNFDEDFQLYGTGAAALDLGAIDSLFAEGQGDDAFKKGLLAG